MDYSNILLTHYSGKDWSIIGNDYDALIWNDSSSKPTKDELDAKIREFNDIEPMRLLREERDKRIAKSDWRVTKAKETGTNIPTAWKNYRQALRDLPSSANPTLGDNGVLDVSSITWPTEPF